MANDEFQNQGHRLIRRLEGSRDNWVVPVVKFRDLPEDERARQFTEVLWFVWLRRDRIPQVALPLENRVTLTIEELDSGGFQLRRDPNGKYVLLVYQDGDYRTVMTDAQKVDSEAFREWADSMEDP